MYANIYPLVVHKMRTVKQHFHKLKALCHGKGKTRNALIRSLKSDEVRTICQCAANTLRGNVPLTKLQKTRLSRHKDTLRLLAKKKVSLKRKKKLLLQKGKGIFPFLLAPILSAVASTLFPR